ncbi:MAG: riboflavin synthase [Sulfurifustaceae bacterium]
MFSGIIESIGTLSAFTPRGPDAHARIAVGGLDLSDVKIGDSIAVSGVCLTATAIGAGFFEADLSAETLVRTTFNRRQSGDRVNLEKALALGQRLGGHLVSGHVDGVGKLASRENVGGSVKLTFDAPRALGRYIAEKGSICVDGVSLTVNHVDGARFAVNLVPHTLAMTTLGSLKTGDDVNIEVDLLARYLERLLQAEP